MCVPACVWLRVCLFVGRSVCRLVIVTFTMVGHCDIFGATLCHQKFTFFLPVSHTHTHAHKHAHTHSHTHTHTHTHPHTHTPRMRALIHTCSEFEDHRPLYDWFVKEAQDTVTHCNTLQHTSTHCNTHTAVRDRR